MHLTASVNEFSKSTLKWYLNHAAAFALQPKDFFNEMKENMQWATKPRKATVDFDEEGNESFWEEVLQVQDKLISWRILWLLKNACVCDPGWSCIIYIREK